MTPDWIPLPLLIVASLVLWFLLGCLVLASLDDERQSLFKWCCAAPLGLYTPTVMLWPIVAFFWLRKPAVSGDEPPDPPPAGSRT